MARRLVVDIVGDSSSLERAYRRSSGAGKEFGRDVESASRGALAASLSFRGLGRAVTFAAAPFLLSGGIVAGLKSVVDQAEESQRVLGQTENAVKRAGLSWETYGAQVQKAALAQANLSGFDDERLLGTFDAFVRKTGDVNRALQLNALAANVARGRNIELEQAASLVLKASIGQAGALRRLGIDVKAGASNVQLLTALQQKYAGSAEAFGRTAAGAQARFNVALGNTQETIGAALLPTLTTYLNKAADWLNQSENQAKVQRAVGQALGAVKTIVEGLAGVVRTADRVTGSFKTTLELLIGLGVVAKVYAMAGAFTAVVAAETSAATASGVLSARLLAGEAAFIGATTKAGLLLGTLRALGAIGVITIGIELFINRKVIGDKVKDKTGFDINKGLLNPANLGVSGRDVFDHLFGAKDSRVPSQTVGATEHVKALLGNERTGPFNALKTLLDGVNKTTDSQSKDVKRATLKLGQKIELAVSDAETAIARGDQGAQQRLVAALQAQIALDRKYEKIQEALVARGGKNAADHIKTLQRLRQDETSALQQITSIQTQRADDIKQAADDAKAATQQAAENLQSLLELRLTNAQDTRAIGDDLRALGAIEAVLTQRIKAEGRTADLLGQLQETRQKISQTRQFRALNLDPTGNALVSTVNELKRQLGTVDKAVAGTFLDTKKTSSLLGNIRRVLAGGLGAVSQEVRQKVKEMLADLDQQLKDHSGRQTKTRALNTSQVLGGLDLPADLAKQLRARLSVFNTGGVALAGRSQAFSPAGAGGGEIVIHNTIKLDERKVGAAITRVQRKDSLRRPPNRRGFAAGRG